jgi:hypothetical protein
MIFRNDIHKTEIRIFPKGRYLNPKACKKIKRVLCREKNCPCGCGALGEQGEENPLYEIMPDGGVLITDNHFTKRKNIQNWKSPEYFYKFGNSKI